MTDMENEINKEVETR